jgi:hypothetical protein
MPCRFDAVVLTSVLLLAPAIVSAEPTAPKLRQELLERVAGDQKVREAMVSWLKEHASDPSSPPAESSGDDPAFEELTRRVQAVDKANTKWLKRVVRERGWPTYSMVGQDGAKAAWLIVQHADLAPAFQRRCLDLMTKLPADETSPADVAYLTDRVLLAEGKSQRYGTQFILVDGKYVPRPIEDEKHVDERRASVGLQPLDEYASQLRQAYGQTDSGDESH